MHDSLFLNTIKILGDGVGAVHIISHSLFDIKKR